jgi:ribose transport system ATP-binding protein
MRLEMKNINKLFGPVQVLYDVNFEVDANSIHALVGENGAGKSTLVKILTGIYTMNSGEIRINGELVKIHSIIDSEHHKIAIVNQELAVFGEMTVLENLFIGKEKTLAAGIINSKEQKEIATEIFTRLGINLDFNMRVKELSVGMQQMLEIGKSLVNDAELIIMDEPTSALTDREIDMLFKVIRKLKENGKSVIYISHRMKEIFEICDAITVLRDGKFVKRSNTKDITFEEIIRSMVGYELGNLFPDKPQVALGKKLLEVKNLSSHGKFNNISFELSEGEIIGFAGLMGSGRTEIMNALFGIDKVDSGDVILFGNKEHIKQPLQAKRMKIGYVTENRKEEGLFLDFSINENVMLNNLEQLSKNFVINFKKSKNTTLDYAEKVRLRYQSIDQTASELSGGNQQKVVLSKWLANDPRILILDEPTRGIDVNAKKQIYEMIYELKKIGIGIIVVSSELVELLGIVDKIYVIHEGEMAAELVNDNLTDEVVMKHMMGG